MKFNTCHTLCLYLVLATASIAGQSRDVPQGDKLSRSARTLVESSGDNVPHNYWVYLDRSAVDMSTFAVSERSLRRRAKVDPVTRLIDTRDYPISSRAINAVESSGAEVLYASRWFRAVAVSATYPQLQQLASLSMVDKVEVARELTAPAPPEPEPVKRISVSPKASALAYGIARFQNNFIRATKLHDADYTGNGVMIAFFDTGFQIHHRAFDSANIVMTRDFINGDTTVDEPDCPTNAPEFQQTYHGTLTLGVVASDVPDTLVGVAPHADFILAKTEITCNGTEIKMEEYNWIAAAEWADSVGADIITSSLGYFIFQDSGSYTQSQLDGKTALITLAAEAAASKNILVVNSAGNDRGTLWGTIDFPADGDSVLAIGATYPDSSVTSFSSPGPTADGRIKPDVSTLGWNVQTAYQFGGYTSASGTSLSAPLVAGGAALALESDPTMTAEELRTLIRQTASMSNSPNNNVGYGLFNATAAADILTVSDIPDVTLQIDESAIIPITTSGRSPQTPVIAAHNLPSMADFQDFGDGTARLSITAVTSDPPERLVTVTATVGSFTDSVSFTVRTYRLTGRSFYAVPNPFTDETNIYAVPADGSYWTSITIFTPAGEPVWERVNKSGPTADVIVKWDGRNMHGERVASGVYLVQITTSQDRAILKVLKTE